MTESRAFDNRIRVNVISMLTDRGMKLHSMLSDEGGGITVFYLNEPPLSNLKFVRGTRGFLLDADEDEVVNTALVYSSIELLSNMTMEMVLTSMLNSNWIGTIKKVIFVAEFNAKVDSMTKLINKLNKPDVKVQLFQRRKFICDVSEHYMQPDTLEILRARLKQDPNKIRKAKWMRILLNDPYARWFGCEEGDIMITTKSTPANGPSSCVRMEARIVVGKNFSKRKVKAEAANVVGKETEDDDYDNDDYYDEEDDDTQDIPDDDGPEGDMAESDEEEDQDDGEQLDADDS